MGELLLKNVLISSLQETGAIAAQWLSLIVLTEQDCAILKETVLYISIYFNLF